MRFGISIESFVGLKNILEHGKLNPRWSVRCANATRSFVENMENLIHDGVST
jgi:hypothetical protein